MALPLETVNGTLYIPGGSYRNAVYRIVNHYNLNTTEEQVKKALVKRGIKE